MILSDGEIKEYIKKGSLEISPIEDIQIQPASVDITLGNTFTMLHNIENGVISPGQEFSYETFTAEKYMLLPGQFVLATTREFISLPNNLTAFVEGRSSWGRLGLFIQNAGWVDPGFKGEITLELFNANRYAIELKSGIRIGQLVFAQMAFDAECPYNGKYQGQRSATGSRVFLDYSLQEHN